MIEKYSGHVRRCIDDYNMIDQNEEIAIGVSGGKDSLALLCIMANLSKYHPKNFKVHAVTLDMGFGSPDFTGVRELCDRLSVPFTVERSDIAGVVFNERKEKNPCSLCAKMRRAALCNMINGLGIRKIALAHHHDDAIETFMLSLLYEGRLNCFQPVTYLNRTEITQIRPMLYVGEKAIIGMAKSEKLPIVHNPCPMNGVSKREEIKKLIRVLGATYPDIKNKLFGAMKRLPLAGW